MSETDLRLFQPVAQRAELPLRVICEMLGTPREDARFLKDLGDVMVGNSDPDYNPTSSGAADGAGEAQMEMFNYFKSLATEREKKPGDDLVSVLLRAEIDAGRTAERRRRTAAEAETRRRRDAETRRRGDAAKER